MADNVAELEAEYLAARDAWETAYNARFPDNNREELKAAHDETFAVWDAAWVEEQQAHLEPSDAPEVVHEDQVN